MLIFVRTRPCQCFIHVKLTFTPSHSMRVSFQRLCAKVTRSDKATFNSRCAHLVFFPSSRMLSLYLHSNYLALEYLPILTHLCLCASQIDVLCQKSELHLLSPTNTRIGTEGSSYRQPSYNPVGLREPKEEMGSLHTVFSLYLNQHHGMWPTVRPCQHYTHLSMLHLHYSIYMQGINFFFLGSCHLRWLSGVETYQRGG